MAHAGKEIHQNYLNTFYRCITESKMICHDMVEEHKIVYIMSGRLTLRCGNHKVDVENGQAVFVRRNHLVKEYKQPGSDGKPFKGLFFHLNSSDLRNMEGMIEIPIVKADESLNYLCDMNVEQFAHFSGRSLSGFKREFFEIFGSTPHQWIMDKRLGYAKKLIESKNCPLSDVYLKAGFKNPTHFATCYKKRFGQTPSEASTK